jgi:hypothetical protein
MCHVRIFSFFPCILLFRVFKVWEMSGRKATLLHQVSSLSRSASPDSSDEEKKSSSVNSQNLETPALEIATSGDACEQLPWQNTVVKTTSAVMACS